MLIVVADFYSNNTDPLGALGKKKYIASLTKQREQLLKADELLHARLWQLQSMDQQYSSLLTVQRDDASLAKSNASIEAAEQSFQKAIDSIHRMGSQYDEQAGTNDFQNLTGFFKTILENRRFLTYTRSALNSNDKGASSYITILKLQEELQRKDKLLAAATDKNAEKEKVELQNAIAERDKQIQILQTAIQKEQVEKQTYASQVQKLEAAVTEKDKLLASSANKLPADQKALHNLQTQVTDKNNQVRNLEAQIQKDQSEKQGYLQTVKKLQTELNEKNKVIAETANKRSADQKAFQGLQTQVTDKNNQILKLQADLNEKNKLLVAATNKKSPVDQKALASLQSQITDKNNQIRSLEAQVRKEQSEKQATAQSLQKLEAQLIEKNKIIAAANTKLPANQKTLVNLQKEVAQKNDQIRSLQAAIQKEQAEKKSYTQTVQNLQNLLAQKEKQLAASSNKTPSTDQKALTSLQNSVAEKDKRIRALEDQVKQSQVRTTTDRPVSDDALKKLQQKNNNLTLAYNNTQAQINLLIRKYNALKSENDLLRNSQR
jgi:chromosome segregation ATPase